MEGENQSLSLSFFSPTHTFFSPAVELEVPGKEHKTSILHELKILQAGGPPPKQRVFTMRDNS